MILLCHIHYATCRLSTEPTDHAQFVYISQPLLSIPCVLLHSHTSRFDRSQNSQHVRPTETTRTPFNSSKGCSSSSSINLLSPGSQILTVPSYDPHAMRLPSGEKATDVTQVECLPSLCALLVSLFQIITIEHSTHNLTVIWRISH